MKENLPLYSTFAVYRRRFRACLSGHPVVFGADRDREAPEMDITAVMIGHLLGG
jgi:hypothetical protein